MSDNPWTKVRTLSGVNLPEIPAARDYIEVEAKLYTSLIADAFYSRRWGWRDSRFNELFNVVEWRYRDGEII